jgi:hypothetical protein
VYKITSIEFFEQIYNTKWGFNFHDEKRYTANQELLQGCKTVQDNCIQFLLVVSTESSVYAKKPAAKSFLHLQKSSALQN